MFLSVLHWKSEIGTGFNKAFCFSKTQARTPLCKCISPLWGKAQLWYHSKEPGVMHFLFLGYASLPTTAGVDFPPRWAPKSHPHWATYKHHEMHSSNLTWLLPERPECVKSKTQEIVSMWKQLCLYYSSKHEVLNRPWVEMTACLKVYEACIEHAQE